MPVIVTDSTCDLSLNQLASLQVTLLPLTVRFGNESYIDKVTITDDLFYDRLEKCDELPSTALLSIGEFLECFEKYPRDEIVVLTISSRLSGTYQSARAAVELSGRANIYIVDSMTVTGGLALLVQRAAALRDAGKSGCEIAQEMEEIKGRVRIFAFIDTLKYLVKGGRLSGVGGAVGGLLGLRPIISVEDGAVRNLSKPRGVPAAINELVRLITQEHPFDPAQPCLFVHTKNPDAVKLLAKGLGLSRKSVPVQMLGSSVGTHVGPGAAGFCYFEKAE